MQIDGFVSRANLVKINQKKALQQKFTHGLRRFRVIVRVLAPFRRTAFTFESCEFFDVFFLLLPYKFLERSCFAFLFLGR